MSFVPEQTLQQTAFGELTTALKDPEIQVSAQYDTSDLVREVTVAGGTTGITGGEFFANSGTDPAGIAAIFTDNQIISKPGQGVEILMGARFDAGAVDSRQSAGASTASDGISFGFESEEFGVFFIHDGRVQVEELTVTNPTGGGGENATVTVNGTGYTVPLTSGTVQHNAAEIADSLNSQVALYNFSQNNDQVVCRSIFAAPESGAFSFTGSTAAASWSQVSDGVSSIEEFFPQTKWNGDQVLTGDFILDPTMINTYKIVHNGDISYYVLNGATEEFILVHRVVHANTEQTPMFSTSSFRLAWTSTNRGGTSEMTARGTFAAAFNQGVRTQTIGTESAFNTESSVGSTPTSILNIRCREVFGTKVNLGRMLPIGITAATDGNKGAIVQVIKNATFADDLNFQYQNKEGSIAEIDKTATDVTGGDVLTSLAIIGSISLGAAIFKNILLPGDTVSLVMNVPSGAGADMNASIIWEEDL